MTIFIIQLHQAEINNPHIEYNDTQLFTEVEDIYQSGGHFAILQLDKSPPLLTTTR